MKILVFCSHPLVIPSLQALMREGTLSGLIVPDRIDEATQILLRFSRENNISLTRVNRSLLAVGQEGGSQEIPSADMALVITFPFKIPLHVLRLFPLGVYNFHTGFLPGYRGPDPVFWMIRNGEKNGGATIHRMEESLDTGPILHVEEEPIEDGDTYGIYHMKLAYTIQEGMNRVLSMIQNAKENPSLVPQDEKMARYYKRPVFADLCVDWNTMNSYEITNLVRAANPSYGGAYVFIKNLAFRLLETLPLRINNPGEEIRQVRPGTLVAIQVSETGRESEELLVLCKDGVALRLEVVGSEMGFFSGKQFVKKTGLHAGDAFLPPPVFTGVNPSSAANRETELHLS